MTEDFVRLGLEFFNKCKDQNILIDNDIFENKDGMEVLKKILPQDSKKNIRSFIECVSRDFKTTLTKWITEEYKKSTDKLKLDKIFFTVFHLKYYSLYTFYIPQTIFEGIMDDILSIKSFREQFLGIKPSAPASS